MMGLGSRRLFRFLAHPPAAAADLRAAAPPASARGYAGRPKKGSKPPKAELMWSQETMPRIAVVGRPNVGKSALYNRLVQKRDALVYNTPDSHVTRDHREGVGQLGDLKFIAVDNAGLECNAAKGSIQERAVELARHWISRSDIAMLVIDARQGVIPQDMQAAKWLRSYGPSRVLLVANKCERRRGGELEVAAVCGEAYRLGLGEAVAISAESGEGMADLYQALQPMVDEVTTDLSSLRAEGAAEAEEDQPLQFAILGRPNAGKSTLVNALLGETRCLTGPEPGLTRDATYTRFLYEGQKVWLVDTAGWMKRSKLETLGKPAMLSGMAAERSMQRAHVVLMIVDAEEAATRAKHGWLTKPELGLAQEVFAEGRALVVLANKLDALPAAMREGTVAGIQATIAKALPQGGAVPVLGISALQGDQLDMIMPTVMRQYELWNTRITTARLNRWLVKVAARNPSGGGGSGEGRIRYITQYKTRPPSFVAWVTGAKDFSDNMSKHIAALMRADFGLDGLPIRVVGRRQHLPPKFAGFPSLSAACTPSHCGLEARQDLGSPL
mmetsp:Transcript_2748/g.9301  ORF Transcript_2748/g.9301 Transcript_2748/m.9301 type:complete len:556 (+) Transcript_2748:2-1669(+)